MKLAKRLLAVILSALFVFGAAAPAFAEDSNVIKEVRLTITEPETGAVPDTVFVSAEPDKYIAKIRYWLKRTYPDETVSRFEAGYEYAVVFEIEAASGYKFETPKITDYGNSESSTVVYVNGVNASCTAWETDTRLVRVYAVKLDEPQEEETNFFVRIINAVVAFFAGIAEFFKNLF